MTGRKHLCDLYKMENKTLTQRGRECLLHEGFVYMFDRTNVDGEIKFWRCQAKNVNCKARLHTRDGQVIKAMNAHNHESIPIGIKMKNIRKKIKKKACNDNNEISKNDGKNETIIAADGNGIDPLYQRSLTKVKKSM